ncbi:hypothetical protein D3C85_1198870 [compost metagenome]
MVGQLFHVGHGARAVDQRMVRQHHALGLARRARGIEHGRGIVRLDGGDGALEKFGMLRGVLAALFLELLIRQQHRIGVMAQAARIVEHHMLEGGALFTHLDHLVDLLLVFHDRDPDLGVLQHVDHLLGDGVLVERNGNRAQRLRGHHGHVEAGTVLADDGDVHAGLDAKRRKALRDVADMLRHLGPRKGLPDPQILLSYRGPRPANVGMREQQRWKGVQRRRHLCRCGR